MQNTVTNFAPKNSYVRRRKQPTIKEWAKEIQEVLLIGPTGLYFGQRSPSIVLTPND